MKTLLLMELRIFPHVLTEAIPGICFVHSRPLPLLPEEKMFRLKDSFALTKVKRELLQKGTRQMRTGNDATQSGLYASECCTVEKAFKIDDCFTRCPKCESLCEWEIVDVIVAPDGAEKIEHQAA